MFLPKVPYVHMYTVHTYECIILANPTYTPCTYPPKKSTYVHGFANPKCYVCRSTQALGKKRIAKLRIEQEILRAKGEQQADVHGKSVKRVSDLPVRAQRHTYDLGRVHFIHAHTCIHIHTRTRTCTRTHTHPHPPSHTCTHIHMRTYAHTHAHTHKHTHTHSHAHSCFLSTPRECPPLLRPDPYRQPSAPFWRSCGLRHFYEGF